jgi:hypothetical protein
MRGGIGAARPEQKLLAFAAGRKAFGSLAIGLGLIAKPLFKRHGLLETSSLHDVLLSFRGGGSATAFSSPAALEDI